MGAMVSRDGGVLGAAVLLALGGVLAHQPYGKQQTPSQMDG